MTELELMRARRDEYIATSNRDLEAKREAEAKLAAKDAEIARLKAQLAKAREDTARLDWREQNPHDSGPLPKWQDIHDPPGIVWVYGPKQTQYKTLRQALDAAREKGPTA